jgi:hypothetical protein
MDPLRGMFGRGRTDSSASEADHAPHQQEPPATTAQPDEWPQRFGQPAPADFTETDPARGLGQAPVWSEAGRDAPPTATEDEPITDGSAQGDFEPAVALEPTGPKAASTDPALEDSPVEGSPIGEDLAADEEEALDDVQPQLPPTSPAAEPADASEEEGAEATADAEFDGDVEEDFYDDPDEEPGVPSGTEVEAKSGAEAGAVPGPSGATKYDIDQQNLVNSTAFGHLEVAGDFVMISGQPFEYSDINQAKLKLQVDDYFVEPEGFAKIREDLSNRSTSVVILAAPEGGHDFAGRALLHACKGMAPRRIGPRSGPKVQAAELAHCKGTAWLLNLTDLEDANWEDLFEHFNGLATELGTQRSALVVVVNRADIKDLSLIGKHGVQMIKRPDPYLVFNRHLIQALRAAKLENTTKTVDQWEKRLRDLQQLDKRPPAEAARLCAAVFYTEQSWEILPDYQQKVLLDDFVAQHRLPEGADVTSCVEVLVRDRFDSWVEELDRWNQQHVNDPLIKAFQVAAALHPSGDPAKAREAALKLLKIAFPDDQPPRSLNGPGVRLMVGMIGAELQRGKIVFPRPGFQEAVVRYFWDDRMEIQEQLLTWMMGLVPKARPTDKAAMAVRKPLVERIGYFAIHHAQQCGKLDFLQKIVLAWAKSDDETARSDAVLLLELAAEASVISRAVRKLMLRWATGTDPVQKRVVAEVCISPTFATRHPRLMAVRLVHVVGDDQGKNAVPEATRLAASELLIRAGDTDIVLDKVVSYLASDDGDVKKRGTRLFIATAQVTAKEGSTPALIEQAASVEGSRTKLVALWVAALRHLRREDVQPAYDAWVNACTTTALEELVVAIVLDAVRAETLVANSAAKVWSLADRWPDASVFGKERTEELVNRFQSEATGIINTARSGAFHRVNGTDV